MLVIADVRFYENALWSRLTISGTGEGRKRFLNDQRCLFSYTAGSRVRDYQLTANDQTDRFISRRGPVRQTPHRTHGRMPPQRQPLVCGADGVMQMAKRIEVEISLVELVKDIPWFIVDGKKYEPKPGKKAPKYSGALRRPIVQQTIPKDQTALLDIFLQRLEKLQLLRKHFGVQDGEEQWLYLALRLACLYVPGFRVRRVPQRKIGRPRKWDPEVVVTMVEAFRRGRTWREAIRDARRYYPDIIGSLTLNRFYAMRAERKGSS